jgi:hypothetical protein
MIYKECGAERKPISTFPQDFTISRQVMLNNRRKNKPNSIGKASLMVPPLPSKDEERSVLATAF